MADITDKKQNSKFFFYYLLSCQDGLTIYFRGQKVLYTGDYKDANGKPFKYQFPSNNIKYKIPEKSKLIDSIKAKSPKGRPKFLAKIMNRLQDTLNQQEYILLENFIEDRKRMKSENLPERAIKSIDRSLEKLEEFRMYFIEYFCNRDIESTVARNVLYPQTGYRPQYLKPFIYSFLGAESLKKLLSQDYNEGSKQSQGKANPQVKERNDGESEKKGRPIKKKKTLKMIQEIQRIWKLYKKEPYCWSNKKIIEKIQNSENVNTDLTPSTIESYATGTFYKDFD